MTGPKENGSGYRERNSTADRTLVILDMFDETRLAIGALEVAEELGVARSTAYRYVQSLVSSGFLEEDAGRFRLGRRVLELARLARRGIGLSEVARPVMRRLAQDLGETVLLTRRAGSTVICLEREEATSQTVRISYERGQVLPLNAGASAFVLLAWLPPDDLHQVLAGVRLEQFTPRTLTTLNSLLLRLQETASQGYGLSRGELDPDVLGVAAPIHDAQGKVTAALSMAAVASRFEGADLQSVVDRVSGAARRISASLQLVS